MIDMKFTLHYFARDREWRVYSESGGYATFKTMDEFPRAIGVLLRDVSQVCAALAPPTTTSSTAEPSVAERQKPHGASQSLCKSCLLPMSVDPYWNYCPYCGEKGRVQICPHGYVDHDDCPTVRR